MFTKLHHVLYTLLFNFYGALALYYCKKLMEDDANSYRWERKYEKCVDIREDILDVMYTLKGLN